MSQHSLVIANESGLLFRGHVNTALQAVSSQQSGATEPSTTYAYQLWMDTSGGSPILKIRNAANSAWIILFQGDLAYLGTRTGTTAISNASQSVAITYSSALPSASHSLTFSFKNVTDTDPIQLTGVITAQSTTGATITFNAPADSANYSLTYKAEVHV